MMDWQSSEGESNEGMVGDFVNFGAVGPEHVQNEVKNKEGEIIQHQDDVFIIIAPVRRPEARAFCYHQGVSRRLTCQNVSYFSTYIFQSCSNPWWGPTVASFRCFREW